MTEPAVPGAAEPLPRREPLPQRQVALIDLLDRLLSGGVVITGDVLLSIADIDLVRVSLRALIVSVDAETRPLWARALPEGDPDAR
ncbi:gas vesicle protein [Streptomyces sp. NPDC096176]|uniref:gas vesicle protein n=1 Tax=Streptomyces sp. NPDC096176 TaxID=3366079 RepID=UPI003830EEB9